MVKVVSIVNNPVSTVNNPVSTVNNPCGCSSLEGAGRCLREGGTQRRQDNRWYPFRSPWWHTTTMDGVIDMALT